MNNRILKKICYFLRDPKQVLSCCKKFTINRKCNIRWRNRIYFRDNSIKITNSSKYYYEQQLYDETVIIKEVWYKNRKKHCDKIDPKTGYTLPAYIDELNKIKWHKEGEKHRDDIDHQTGLTLPSVILDIEEQFWYKKGILFRDDIDPNTGFYLPFYSYEYIGEQSWRVDRGKQIYEIDPETGLTLPSEINAYSNLWYKDDNLHRDEIDPDTGFTLPAFIRIRSKMWYKNGIQKRDDVDPETRLPLPTEINF